MHLRRNGRYKIDFPALQAAAPGPVETLRRGAWLQVWHPDNGAYRRAALPIRNLPESLVGLRILHLSDLHLKNRWCRGYDELIERVRTDPPDLILFTGDFTDNKSDHRPALPIVRRLVGGLVARQGIYAILGNHDPDVIRPYLVDLGVRFVSSRRVIAPARGRALELIGMPGLSRHDLDMDFVRALPPKEPGVPRLVLCHYPDLFCTVMGIEPDLFLAGHTHGGQVCTPSGMAVMTHDVMPRRFCKGIHRIGPTWYAVSSGLGFTKFPVRLFCPTEAVEFVFTATEQQTNHGCCLTPS